MLHKRKRDNCENVATSGRPSQRQSFSALITTLSLKSLSPWLYYSVSAADKLLHAVTLTIDL